MVVVAVLLLLPGTLAAKTPKIRAATITTGTGPTPTSGSGSVKFCPGTTVTIGGNGATAWLCMRATASGSNGYGRGWDQLQAYTQYSLSVGGGLHSYYGLGFLQLPRGFAVDAGNCSATASASARTYVFWHIWVWDNTTAAYVDQSASGYIWDSGTVGCPVGGGAFRASSPALTGTFNSSSIAGGPSWFTFTSSHTYTFVFFLGCTVEASLSTTTVGDFATARCNPAALSAATVTATQVVLG